MRRIEVLGPGCYIWVSAGRIPTPTAIAAWLTA